MKQYIKANNFPNPLTDTTAIFKLPQNLSSWFQQTVRLLSEHYLNISPKGEINLKIREIISLKNLANACIILDFYSPPQKSL